MTPPSPGHGPVDRLFDVLSDARRRTILSYLREHRRPTTFAELVEAVLEREACEEASPDDEHVAASLHHVHLPKLQEAGLITWTADGAVALDDSVIADDHLAELLGWNDCPDACL